MAIPTANPSIEKGQYASWPMSVGEEFERRANSVRRYYAVVDDGEWPPELADYNNRFAQTLDKIKRRHDSVVTTVGESSNDLSLSFSFLNIRFCTSSIESVNA